MSLTPQSIAKMFAALVGVTAAACTGPTVQKCHRYDGVSLSRDNQFSSRLDWKNGRMVDLPMERVEVALTVIRPINGPIELVHLVGNVEADRWTLTLPDLGSSPTSLCAIMGPGVASSCGATLKNIPFSPGGYYYLQTGDNTVLEAGLAFILCD